jgi:hypothetical protein
MPKFQDITTWQQAETLMQPVFIRLIDNIRKQLEQSSWQGSYVETAIWPEGTSEEVKFRVNQLQAELDTVSPERADEIEEALAELPSPFLRYQLCLKQHDHEIYIDLWDVCYQICFQNYDPNSGTSHISDDADQDGVEVDTSLLDETGEVDWNRLDEKTHAIVAEIFTGLPS